MATPPSLGKGIVCTCRSSCGGSSQPWACANSRMYRVKTSERRRLNEKIKR